MRILKSLLQIWIAIYAFTSIAEAQVTCTTSGTWSGTAVWSPSTPVAGDNIIVAAGCTLYVDIVTPQINDLTILGVVIINNDATSILSMEGNLIVNSSAALVNNGKINYLTPGNGFNLNGTATYIHNPFNNVNSDEDIFTNSLESFSTTSNLIIQKWSNGNTPLAGPVRVQSSVFGNVTLDASVPGGTWDQDGFFSSPTPNRIKGSLTVSQNTVVMDDGTGSTTSLILQDVTVNGTGNIIFQRGYNRNYSLQVNNFTLNSVAPAKPTVVLDTSFGILNMTVNGSMNLAYDFNAVFGGTYLSGADIRITVNGNLNITGGKVIFNNKASAPLLLNVAGTTTLNNASPGGAVCLVEGANGALTFNTQDLFISGGNSNYLYGWPGVVPAVKGTATLNISNDFSINGSSTTYVAYSDTSVSKVRINIGRDFTCNGANSLLVGAYTNGAFTFKTGRNYNQTNGKFIGQAYKSNIAIDSIITGGNFTFNSGTASDYFKGNKSSGNTFIITNGNFSVLSSGIGYGEGFAGVDSSSANLSFIVSQNFIQNGGQFSGILSGSGILTFTITGILDVNGGVCKIHNNTIYSNPGNIIFNVGSIDYDGGVFSAFYSCNNNGLTGNFTIGGNCKVNFGSPGDEFSFIGLSIVGSDVNNLQLNLNIPGLLSIGGLNGTFVSSVALGAEFLILNNLSISNGTNSFNGKPGPSGSIGHYVSLTVNGNVDISGGSTYFSAQSQTILANIIGDVQISGGSLSLKGAGTSTSTLNIRGAYNQSGGNFYLHNNTSEKMPEGSAITVTTNSDDDNTGNFTQTGGSIIFDNCTTTPASMNLTLAIKNPVYTLGGNGQMTMTMPGTGAVHGILSFSRNGTIQFNRSGNHDIQQVKQNILSGCTLDLVSGDLQVASHNTAAIPPDALWVYTGGILSMRTNKLYSNASKPNSGVSVFGRVRTQNINGLYDGTTNAAFSTTIIDNLDFYIASSSTIEYYGDDNQVITGLGIGKAQLTQHKYGNLEINFGGTPDVEFVYPSNIPNDSVVMVRSGLILTNGELNLDNDHDPLNGGGRWIVLENNAVSAMSRTNGYIRSESYDSNGRVKWIFNSVTGSHIVHFGYDAANYIPMTFNHASGSGITLYASTYHSDPLNLPYPPTVSHVNNNSGTDNSANTVDRFWYIHTNGNLPSANITFIATAAETGTLTNLVAQRWYPIVPGWTNPAPGVQSSLAFGVQANSLTTINDWWTLSGNSVLLPIELLSFRGKCTGNLNKIEWETATETNNDYFSLEKSSDAENWSTLSIVQGAGTSSHNNFYSFDDENVRPGITYYRIQQTDFDGKSSISQIISVRSCKERSHFNAEVLTSASGLNTLYINSDYNEKTDISIYSLGGKLLDTFSIQLHEGDNMVPLNHLRLSKSLYFIHLTGAGQTMVIKFHSGS